MDYISKLGTLTPPQKMNQLIIDNFGQNFDVKKPKVIIVGLCGGQGGGKTKLSKILCKNIPNSAIIEERSYFKIMTLQRKLSYEIEPLFDEIGGYSKDRKLLMVELSNPSSYDYEKLYQNLKSLKEGKDISVRIFSEDKGNYTGEEVTIKTTETCLIILEGYFLFRDKNVRDLIDLKIYVEIDDDIRLSRLLLNENKFLNNDSLAIKNFFMIYKNYIKTSYEQYIEPTKHEARIILPNYTVRDDEVIDGDETFESLVLMLKSIVKSRNSDYKGKAHQSNK
jgi:uridine kinase